MEKISLQEMVGGALQEQFEKSFLRVVENLSDPNTPFKDCRKICIESEPEIPCNPETGEIIEPVPTTVIDMRKVMKA